MKRAEVQKEHIKQLKCAVRLSQVDLARLREGDWQNLREELYEFMNPIVAQRLQEVFLPPDTKEQLSLSTDTVAAIQKQIAADLQQYAYNGNNSCAVTLRPKQLDIDFVAFGPDIVFYQIVQTTDPVASARLALGLHLVGAVISPAYIRSCPECSRLFVMERKPRLDVANYFCSIRCSRNAATKRYRERHRELIKEREKQRSRKRYEKRIRSQAGKANVKVARRPR